MAPVNYSPNSSVARDDQRGNRSLASGEQDGYDRIEGYCLLSTNQDWQVYNPPCRQSFKSRVSPILPKHSSSISNSPVTNASATVLSLYLASLHSFRPVSTAFKLHSYTTEPLPAYLHQHPVTETMSVLSIIAEAAAFAALDFGIDSIKNGKKDPNGETKVELVIGSGAEGTKMVSSFELC